MGDTISETNRQDNGEKKTHRFSGRFLVWFGVACLISVPVTLFLIYGNNEITTGPVTKIWPLLFLPALLGYIFIALGISRSKKLVDQIAHRVDTPLVRGVTAAIDKPTVGWKAWFVLAIFDAALTIFYWHTNLGGDEPFLRWAALAGVLISIVIVVLTRLFQKSRSPWYLLLIDSRYQPKDEREKSLLQQAALQAMGAVILVVLVSFTILFIAPHPSTLSIIFFASTVLMFIRGIFSYFVWRAGWKE